MWRNPITEKQIRVLTEDWGVKEEVCVTGRTRSITGWFEVLTVSVGFRRAECLRVSADFFFGSRLLSMLIYLGGTHFIS